MERRKVGRTDMEVSLLGFGASEIGRFGTSLRDVERIANAVWRYGQQQPTDQYHLAYWERLRELNYEFLSRSPEEVAAAALRFTIGLPGVATCIVGTTKPGRWQHNASIVRQGPLPAHELEAIRERWREVSQGRNWTGV